MEEDKTVDKEDTVTLTLNSLFRNTSDDSTVMRIKGSMGGKTLHILIDTGSSHNFLSDQFFKKGAVKTMIIMPLRVTVGNGGQVQGSQLIENFQWVIQGQQFSSDVILFPLVGCDLILGMQWLKT